MAEGSGDSLPSALGKGCAACLPQAGSIHGVVGLAYAGLKAWLDAILRGSMALMAPAVFPVNSANALTLDAFASTAGFVTLGLAGLHSGLPDPHIDPYFVSNACLALAALATLKLLTFTAVLMPAVTGRYPCVRPPSHQRSRTAPSGGGIAGTGTKPRAASSSNFNQPPRSAKKAVDLL
eukprot:scaffold3430_cov114-Isochrysis_galbana.AAC.4